MEDIKDQIIELLPYKKPFLFVDELTSISEDGAKGSYELKLDEYFYEGHFPGNPVTPGVIITEIMAQIGLVSMGIYLTLQSGKQGNEVLPFFTSADVNFTAPSFPGDKLIVESKKEYFRFKKLKCAVTCFNETSGKIVARGDLSGMIIDKKDAEG